MRRRRAYLLSLIVAGVALVTWLALRNASSDSNEQGGPPMGPTGTLADGSHNLTAQRGLAKRNTSMTDIELKSAGGDGGSSVYPEPNEAPKNWAPLMNDEALPCTALHAPVNFETYSVGPSIDGLKLTHTGRRCGTGPVAMRANYLSFAYGDCEIPPGETGCRPPLEVHTWPACQRYLAKYSFLGKPLPHRFLSSGDGAVVVEFSFVAGNRIEVYTKSSTVVIFAPNRDLAVRAVDALRAEDIKEPPAKKPDDLSEENPDRLDPPTAGSLEGALSC
jgi:hypothetical protein